MIEPFTLLLYPVKKYYTSEVVYYQKRGGTPRSPPHLLKVSNNYIM